MLNKESFDLTMEQQFKVEALRLQLQTLDKEKLEECYLDLFILYTKTHNLLLDSMKKQL